MASVLDVLTSPRVLVVWEVLEFVSIIIVGVGCWGEEWAEHHKFKENLTDLMPTARINKRWVKRFWLMVVWGLGIELVAFGFAFLASNREIESLRRGNLVLEASIQPRRIMPPHRGEIMDRLKTFSGEKCRVIVVFNQPDAEAYLFALDIWQVLSAAWPSVELHDQFVTFPAQLNGGTGPRTGVSFEARTPKVPGSEAVLSALGEAGVIGTNSQVWVDQSVEAGTLQISVWSKPLPDMVLTNIDRTPATKH